MADDEWFDGDDMDEVLERGDPTPRLVQGYVGSLEDGWACSSALELAERFGGPVVEPTRWPAAAGAPRYVHSAPSPFPGHHSPGYRIFAELPGHEATLLVNGTTAPAPHVPGEQGWLDVPELAEVDGIGWSDDRAAHVVVRRDGLSVHVVMFPSMKEAVATARSLRRVDPP